MVDTDFDDFHKKFYAKEATKKKLVGETCDLTKAWECGSNCCAKDDRLADPE